MSGVVTYVVTKPQSRDKLRSRLHCAMHDKKLAKFTAMSLDDASEVPRQQKFTVKVMIAYSDVSDEDAFEVEDEEGHTFLIKLSLSEDRASFNIHI